MKKEDLENILYHGTLAPSGKNRQPWRFVVIQDDVALKDKIVDIMLAKVEEKKQKGESLGSIENTASIIKAAPVFIAVFNIYQDKILNSNIQSIGACIENMCLSATAKGIGSLWICDIDCCFKELEELLGVTNISLVAGVSIGYSIGIPNPRPRLKLEEVTTWK